jgi:hypothetical protein
MVYHILGLQFSCLCDYLLTYLGVWHKWRKGTWIITCARRMYTYEHR